MAPSPTKKEAKKALIKELLQYKRDVRNRRLGISVPEREIAQPGETYSMASPDYSPD